MGSRARDGATLLAMSGTRPSTAGRSGPDSEPGSESSPESAAAAAPAALDPAGIELDPLQLAELLAADTDVQVIDVREPYERAAGHIAGTAHIALAELAGRAGELAQERPIVFYCRVGSRSQMAAQAFRASGYQAHSLRGGLVRWAQEGRPLEPADGHVADH
jgi:rhodanese-related sulfurtransferase